MGAIEIASLVIGSAAEVIKLAKSALDAARAGNEEEARKLLDEALAKSKAAVLRLEDALKAVADAVEKAIADKFHGGVQP